MQVKINWELRTWNRTHKGLTWFLEMEWHPCCPVLPTLPAALRFSADFTVKKHDLWLSVHYALFQSSSVQWRRCMSACGSGSEGGRNFSMHADYLQPSQMDMCHSAELNSRASVTQTDTRPSSYAGDVVSGLPLWGRSQCTPQSWWRVWLQNYTDW